MAEVGRHDLEEQGTVGVIQLLVGVGQHVPRLGVLRFDLDHLLQDRNLPLEVAVDVGADGVAEQ